MNKFFISFVVCTFNNESTIKSCLDSIIEFSNGLSYEIIIINDGSNDSTLDILNNYKEFSMISIHNQTNFGLGYSRNKALKFIKGKYAIFVDGDDQLNLINKNEITSLLMANSNCDIFCLNVTYISRNSKVNYLYQSNIKNYIYETHEKKLLFYSRFLNLSESWGKIYKTSFLLSSNLKFHEYSNVRGSDFLFNHQLILFKPNILVSPLYFYIYFHPFKIRNVNKEFETLLFLFNSLYKFYESRLEKGIFYKVKIQISSLFASFLFGFYTESFNYKTFKLLHIKLFKNLNFIKKINLLSFIFSNKVSFKHKIFHLFFFTFNNILLIFLLYKLYQLNVNPKYK